MFFLTLTCHFSLSLSITDCPKYQYGYNCNENCSVNCDGSRQCDSESGHCKDGCKIGWKAPTCNTSTTAALS